MANNSRTTNNHMVLNHHTLKVKVSSNRIHNSLDTAKPLKVRDRVQDLTCHHNHSIATTLPLDNHRTDIILTTDQPLLDLLVCQPLGHPKEVWGLEVHLVEWDLGVHLAVWGLEVHPEVWCLVVHLETWDLEVHPEIWDLEVHKETWDPEVRLAVWDLGLLLEVR